MVVFLVVLGLHSHNVVVVIKIGLIIDGNLANRKIQKKYINPRPPPAMVLLQHRIVTQCSTQLRCFIVN